MFGQCYVRRAYTERTHTPVLELELELVVCMPALAYFVLLRTLRATKAFYSRSGDIVLLPFKHSMVTAVKDRSPSVPKAKPFANQDYGEAVLLVKYKCMKH